MSRPRPRRDCVARVVDHDPAVLPADHRLRDSGAFGDAVRHGVRAGSSLLVVHMTRRGSSTAPVRVGLVVSRAVGDAVTRNRVKRRLRHLLRADLGRWSDGTLVVVRALPAAATATGAELRAELERCLSRATRKADARMSAEVPA